MAFSAYIPITRGQSIIPSTSWFLPGGDGKHYVVVGTEGTDTTTQIKVGCAETETTIWTRNWVEWSADLAALLLDGGSGAITAPPADPSVIAQGPIPIPNTKYFYIPGGAQDTSGNFWVIFLRYRIDNSTTVVTDGAVGYKRSGLDGVSPASGCWTFGADIVDGQLFVVAWMFFGAGTYLLRIPSDGFGTEVLISDSAAWTSRRTFIGGASQFGDILGVATYFTNPTDYFNRCVILKSPNPDSVRILTYRSHESVPAPETDLLTAGSEYVDVNYLAQTLGSLTNAQALLGQPWSDEGLGYVGTATLDPDRDRYVGPSVLNNEVLFSRVFADALTKTRTRRFTYNSTTGTFTTGDVIEGVVPRGNDYPTLDRGAVAAREGDYLLIGKYGVGGWVIGDVLYPIPDSEPTGRGITFSLLKNSDFVDWETQADNDFTEAANFESCLWTYFHFISDQILWMDSPYVYTYLQNESRNGLDPSLVMEALWDWTEDTTVSHKRARATQLYDFKQDQTVSNTKNRIRGSGRGLQLKFCSEEGLDWHLLGWGVFFDKNTKY